jgi:glycerol-3-phosphate acyltransferase PlsY
VPPVNLPLVAAAAVTGYLVGSVSPATFVARRAGADLRASGSGNPGATNVGRVLGRKWGVLVALLDVAKGAVPAAAFGAGLHEAGLLAGLGAMLGHVTSPWLRGRGGKGVATAAGAILGSHPLWALVILGVWVLVVAASRWVALGSVAAALTIPVLAVTWDGRRADIAWAAALCVVVVARHRRNFVRWWQARRA